jgi:hypothetical protein
MTYRLVLGYKQAMESRGCLVRFKKTTTFDQIALLTQLPQIPQFIAPVQSLWNYMIDVHLAFCLTAYLATSITLEHHLSDLTPSSCAATCPVA